MTTPEVVTWKELHEGGCAYGRLTKQQIEQLEAKTQTMVEDGRSIRKKLDRMTWALAAAALSLATAAVLLALNLILF